MVMLEETRTESGRMILNMGPQHPSTHGVLRVIIKVNGEKVVDLDPVLGYLHRGVEKLCENSDYHHIISQIDPLEYVLVSAPWWLLIAALAGLALLISGRRAAIYVVGCLAAILALRSVLAILTVEAGRAVFAAALVGLVERVVGDDANPRRIAVGDVLQPFGDEAGVMTLAVVQDKYAGRGGGSSSGVDQNNVAVVQGGHHAVAFHLDRDSIRIAQRFS